MGLREDILAAQDVHVEPIDIPEWKVKAWIRPMTGSEREQFDDVVGKKGRLKLKLAVLSLCDDKGARLFSDKDIEALGSKSSVALERVVDAALKLNGMVSAGDNEKNSPGEPAA